MVSLILRVVNVGLTDRGRSLPWTHFIERITILHGVVIIKSIGRTTWSGAGIGINSSKSDIISCRCHSIQTMISIIMLVPTRIVVVILLSPFLWLRIRVIILWSTHSYSRSFPNGLFILHTLELVNLCKLSHLADLTKKSRSIRSIWTFMCPIRFHTLLSTRVHQRCIHEVRSVSISLFGVWPTLLLNRREFLLDRRLASINRIYGICIHVHLLMKTSLSRESVSIETLNRTLVMIITADCTSSWNTLGRMIVRYYFFNFGLRYLGVVYIRWSISISSWIKRSVNDLVNVWLLLLERLLVCHISCAYLILDHIAHYLSVTCHIFTNLTRCSLHASYHLVSGS